MSKTRVEYGELQIKVNGYWVQSCCAWLCIKIPLPTTAIMHLRYESSWSFSLEILRCQQLLNYYFRRETAAAWKVVFGINNLDHPSSYMQTRLVKTIILHPRYSRAVVDYDISIVELGEDISETSYVRPVCLPSMLQSLEPDTYCYITGWGHMGHKSKPGSSAALAFSL